MNTNSNLLQIGDIKVTVFRKPIKNLHLSVLPPDGKVRISAPLHINDEVLKLFLASKISWIRRQKEKFISQERQMPREYISGEDHYFLGRRYRLDVIYKNETPKVTIKGKKIILQVRPYSDVKKREEVLLKWYKNQLRIVAEGIFKKWQKKIGVGSFSWYVRRMKTRWGTCNYNARRIWLNLELIKKPVAYTEYIIVHELIHLIEKKHNQNFIYLMDKYLPNWRLLKENLNRSMLSYERWKY